MDHHFERGGDPGAGRQRAGQVVGQRLARQPGQGRHGAPGRGGVGGVGLDQDLRMIAARQPGAEVAGNGHRELHLAGADHPVQFGRAASLGDKVEIAGVAHRRQDRAGVAAILLDQHGGRQMTGVGVDRIAEQDQLDDRDRQHHRIGQPVARKLFELLDQHRHDPVEGGVHVTLSWLWPISWMNTSSRVGAVSAHR